MGAPDPLDTLAARKAGRPKSTGSLAPRPGRCGAKLRYTGTGPNNPPRYCTQRPAKGNRREAGGNGRCGRFGHTAQQGWQPGVDNPAFKDGRHSRQARLSAALQDAHAAALHSERLLDLTDDVAWLDVLRDDQLAGIDVGASAEGWKQGRVAFRELKAALASGHKAGVRAALGKLDALYEHHTAKALAQEQVGRTLERKAKLVKTRQQVLTESEHLVPLARVATVMAGVAQLVRAFLPDDAARREFSRQFIGFVGQRLRPREGETVDAEVVAP